MRYHFAIILVDMSKRVVSFSPWRVIYLNTKQRTSWEMTDMHIILVLFFHEFFLFIIRLTNNELDMTNSRYKSTIGHVRQ